MDEATTIADARAAWQRLKRRQRASWHDWLCIARALAVGRSTVLQAAGTSRPVGSRYNLALARWLIDNGLEDITAAERYRALLVLDNLPAITAWRDGLDEKSRRRFNHPAAIWHAWQRSLKPQQPPPNLKSPDAPSPQPRPMKQPPPQSRTLVTWPSEFIRRAAEPLGKRLRAGCNDSLVLARSALEAAIRDRTDLIALLDERPLLDRVKTNDGAIEMRA
jgi:hypothetical protein